MEKWPNSRHFFGEKGRYTITNLIFDKILVDGIRAKKMEKSAKMARFCGPKKPSV